jgi:hypothetical protein
MKAAESVTAENKDRSNAMIGAGDLLLRIRKYQEAADMYAAAAPQQDNASSISQRAEIYRKTTIFKESSWVDTDPTVEAQRFFALLMSTKDVDDSLFNMFDYPPSDPKDRALLIRKTQTLCNGLRSRFRSANLPPEVLLDLMMNNLKIAKEGDDKVGYRLVLNVVGGSSMTFFVDDKTTSS